MIIKIDIDDREIPSETRVLEAVQEAFDSLHEGHAIQPPQCSVVLPGSEGDCIFYPGYVRSARAFGVKVSPYLASRRRRGLNAVTAFTLLVNSETGIPEVLVDSMALTTERTAATTLIATRLICGGRAPAKIGVIGTGAIGRSHARYARLCFPEASIVLFSPTAARDDASGDRRRAVIARECPGVQVATGIEAPRSCDVVMLCTSSGTPVIDVHATPRDCLITSVGTNLPDTHEIDWRLLRELNVYCDYRKTCPGTAGDMRKAISEDAWQAEQILADLPEMIGGLGRVGLSGRSYFRATGLALEDIAVARLVAR